MAETTLVDGLSKPVAFGKELRKEFLFDEKYLNINHGSFGTYPRPILSTLRSFQDAHEARPDPFIRYDFPRLLDVSRAAMSEFLSVPVDTLTFVPNATTGINTVLRNLMFKPKDVVIYLAPIYGACEKTVKHITEMTAAESVKIAFEYPVSDAWLVGELKRTITKVKAEGRNVVLAMFDAVVSMPGVRMPFEELVKTCREEGVLSLVDAAHGVGHVDLNLGEGEGKTDPDFLVSNCHKWLFVPRGCAIFYVPVRNQHLLRSTVPTSHGFIPLPDPTNSKAITNPLPPGRNNAYITNFEFVGTIDSSPYLCIPDALEYRRKLGGEKKIMDYCYKLAREGGKKVSEILGGADILENEEGTLGNCYFANVALPIDVSAVTKLVAESQGTSATEADEAAQTTALLKVRDWIAEVSRSEYHTFFAQILYAGRLWVRLSAQVYLEMSDFEWAGNMLKEICERVGKGDFL